ncbi:YbdD/YjiX family protein [Streptomyces sp. PKU-EA00015]|uniref:YbdD/YjiX family protein n=1 Tax=Streptomyces sp. PKU-EA00015 TaxID=2748326 RepID=UPI0015A4A31A|nr:YbdD/YjiX family protein [Streptomyces sp. PKU-EA00015]NWF29411.1 YbdD/YjiX family protein [Streptomyces sp. PKU-EA00015]
MRTGPLTEPLTRLLRGVRWYLREISGAADYDRFCRRHRENHPGAPVPTRRTYERLRARHREENPQSRCC